MNLSPYAGRLVIPDRDPVEGSILFMAVGNNRFAGGGFEVAPLAKLGGSPETIYGIVFQISAPYQFFISIGFGSPERAIGTSFRCAQTRPGSTPISLCNHFIF